MYTCHAVPVSVADTTPSRIIISQPLFLSPSSIPEEQVPERTSPISLDEAAPGGQNSDTTTDPGTPPSNNPYSDGHLLPLSISPVLQVCVARDLCLELLYI